MLLPPSASVAAALGAEGSGEPTLTVAAGDVVRLPCSSGVPTPRSTTWTKDGREVVAGGGPGQRLTLLPDGTLNIAEVTPGDEGSYLCSSTLQDNSTFWTQVRLLVTSKSQQNQPQTGLPGLKHAFNKAVVVQQLPLKTPTCLRAVFFFHLHHFETDYVFDDLPLGNRPCFLTLAHLAVFPPR